MDVSAYTGKRLKLYEYLIDPENREKSIVDVCKAVGISRKYYYQLMGEETFNKAILDTKNRCLARYIARIDKKMAELATEGDPKAAKVIYEILGMIGKGGNQTVNVAVQANEPEGKTINDLLNMPPDQGLAAIEDMRQVLDEIEKNIRHHQEAMAYTRQVDDSNPSGEEPEPQNTDSRL